MANRLPDDGRPWTVDAQRLDEITLLSGVMIEATSRPGPLTQVEIDALLVRRPLVVAVETARAGVPLPRRKQGLPVR